MELNTEIRELAADEINDVAGGRNQIVNFGGGISWVFQFGNDGGLNALWLCTPSQCTDVTAH